MASSSPQTCPIDCCQHSDIPLQPASPQIAKLLSAMYKVILSEIAFKAAVEMVEKGRIHQVLDEFILDAARNNRTLDSLRIDILSIYIPGTVIGPQLDQLIEEALDLCDTALIESIRAQVDVTFKIFVKFLLREPCSNTGMKPDQFCLHHWTNSGVDWNARIKLVKKVEPAFLWNVTPLAIRLDPSSLEESLARERRSGKIKGEQWKPSSERKRKIETPYDFMVQIVCRETWKPLHEAMGGTSVLKFYRKLVDPSSFSLLRLHEYVFAEPTPEDWKKDLLDVVKLNVVCMTPKYLNACCRSLPTLESVVSARRNILHQPSLPVLKAPTTPSSASPPLTPAFDRFRLIKNTSKALPNIPLFASSRACPPDRCSGRPPIIANYESVENLITTIYRDLFSAHLVGYVGCHSGMMSTKVLETLATNLGSFSLEGRSVVEKMKLIDIAYSTAITSGAKSGLGLAGFKEIAPRVLAYLKWAHRDITRPSMPPCLCDLTYLVDHLEQLAFRCAEDLKIAIVQPMDLHSIASHVESVIKEIAGRPSSLLRNDVWTGESWRDEFRELARSMEGLLYKYVRTKAVDFELVPDWRGLLDIATAAQLLEESWYHISNAESPMNNFRLFSEVADDGAETGMVDSASTKLIAGENYKRNELFKSLECFCVATMYDATDSNTRNDLAAVRLILADDDDQSFQWTRVINDCTQAIYYGGPNFKAYYRRGFALAHLKMYKKAILDFEQALLLEPQNPVALLHLALARKNKHA